MLLSITNIFLVIVVLLIFYMILLLDKKIKLKRFRNLAESPEWAEWLNDVFRSNVLTSKNYNDFVSETARQTALPLKMVKQQCSTIFLKYFLIIMSITIITIIITKNILVIIGIYLLTDTLLNYILYEQTARLSKETLEECRLLCTELRQHYAYLNSVSGAMANAVVGENLETAFEELTSLINKDEKSKGLDAYLVRYKFDILRLLAIISEQTNLYGDTMTDDGISSFASSLDKLKDKITSTLSGEHLRLLKMKGLAFLPSAFMVIALALGNVMQLVLPGLRILLDGPIGLTLLAFMIINTRIATEKIAFINRKPSLDLDERTRFEKRVMNNLRVNKFASVVYLSPKERSKLRSLLKDTFSSLSIEFIQMRIFLKSITNFGIVFLAALILITFSRYSIKHSVEPASMTQSTLTETQREHLQNLNKAFYLYSKQNKEFSDENVLEIIRDNTRGLSAEKVKEQTDRLMMNYRILSILDYNILCMILIPLIAGMRAKKQVMKQLEKRYITLRAYQEENILGLIISVIMVMNMNIDTHGILNILRNSTDIFVNILDKAYYKYIGDPNGTLYRLKHSLKGDVFEFKQLISRLGLTVDLLAPREAFANMDKEFNRILSLKDRVTEEILNTNAIKAGGYFTSSFNKNIWAYLLIPIFMLAASLVISLFSNNDMVKLFMDM